MVPTLPAGAGQHCAWACGDWLLLPGPLTGLADGFGREDWPYGALRRFTPGVRVGPRLLHAGAWTGLGGDPPSTRLASGRRLGRVAAHRNPPRGTAKIERPGGRRRRGAQFDVDAGEGCDDASKEFRRSLRRSRTAVRMRGRAGSP